MVLNEELPFADLENQTEFMLVGLNLSRHGKYRNTGLRRRDVEAELKCYVKPGQNIYRAQRIADAIAETLKHQTLDVVDYVGTGNPVVGSLSFNEPQFEDGTAAQNALLPSTGTVVTVRIKGFAEEV